MSSANRYIDLRLLGLNDLHGHLADRGLPNTDPCTGRAGTVGGIATLAAHIRAYRRAHRSRRWWSTPTT